MSDSTRRNLLLGIAGIGGVMAVGAENANAAEATDPELDARIISVCDPRYVGKADLAEKVIFVATRGNDANDGLSLKSAKLTIAAALTVLDGQPGRIQLGAGNFSTAVTHTLPGGTEIAGAGRGLSVITYTGSGSLFQGISGTRTYNQRITEVTILGPGKTTTAVAFDMVDISTAMVRGITLNWFGVGIKHRSIISGGAVYNRFLDIIVNSCGKGVEFGSVGSNGSTWWGVKFGACATAVDITDSNQNNFHACQFEGNTTGVYLTATAAGFSDANSLSFCRFEGNTTAWYIAHSNVRDTQIVSPAVFGTYTVSDGGTRTTTLAGAAAWATTSAVAAAKGSWRFDRYVNVTSDNFPALVVADSASGLGGGPTIQAETARVLGSFYRGVRGGVTYYNVRADGIVTSVGEITPLTVKTGSYSIVDGSSATAGNGTIIANGVSVTIRLPDPTTVARGRRFTVKNIHKSPTTIVSVGTSKKIDGAASKSLAQWANAHYMSDGAQWLTI